MQHCLKGLKLHKLLLSSWKITTGIEGLCRSVRLDRLEGWWSLWRRIEMKGSKKVVIIPKKVCLSWNRVSIGGRGWRT